MKVLIVLSLFGIIPVLLVETFGLGLLCINAF